MRTRNETNRIIIHHSASTDVSAETIRDWHTRGNGWADIGYHYVVRQDGSIETGRDVHVTGAHAKGRNSDSIGICVTGHFGEHAPTMEQYYAVAKLIKGLNMIYGKKLIIERHHDECPGLSFLFEILNRMI